MGKIGLEIKINASKIEKARLFEGKTGKWLTLTTFIDLDNEDQYGNNSFITQKKEQDEEIQMPIIGNSKVFWSDIAKEKEQREPTEEEMRTPPSEEPDDSIPF